MTHGLRPKHRLQQQQFKLFASSQTLSPTYKTLSVIVACVLDFFGCQLSNFSGLVEKTIVWCRHCSELPLLVAHLTSTLRTFLCINIL